MFSQSQPVAQQASAKITGEGGLSDHQSVHRPQLLCNVLQEERKCAYLIGVLYRFVLGHVFYLVSSCLCTCKHTCIHTFACTLSFFLQSPAISINLEYLKVPLVKKKCTCALQILCTFFVQYWQIKMFTIHFKSLFFIIFCHALKMNTYFDVLNNTLKHI